MAPNQLPETTLEQGATMRLQLGPENVSTATPEKRPLEMGTEPGLRNSKASVAEAISGYILRPQFEGRLACPRDCTSQAHCEDNRNKACAAQTENSI